MSVCFSWVNMVVGIILCILFLLMDRMCGFFFVDDWKEVENLFVVFMLWYGWWVVNMVLFYYYIVWYSVWIKDFLGFGNYYMGNGYEWSSKWLGNRIKWKIVEYLGGLLEKLDIYYFNRNKK